MFIYIYIYFLDLQFNLNSRRKYVLICSCVKTEYVIIYGLLIYLYIACPVLATYSI